MASYRLFGAETSPYSLKVRTFLQFKGVDFEWIGRSAKTEEAFQAEAQVPTLPLLIAPDQRRNQDSSSILAGLEAEVSEPCTVPDDAACASLALLLEDYADEWVNKLMVFQRWGQKPDRDAAGDRAMADLLDGELPRAKKKTRDQIIKRMRDNLSLVGIEKKNEKVLKPAFERLFTLLDAHLKTTPFLFGERPSMADFALSAQVGQLLMDPTPAAWLTAKAKAVVAWSNSMVSPVAAGPFRSLEALSPTLLPLIRDEIAQTYLPWATANLAAAEADAPRMSVKIDKKAYDQVTQHYAARAFRDLRTAMKASSDAPGLAAFLEDAGAADLLA